MSKRLLILLAVIFMIIAKGYSAVNLIVSGGIVPNSMYLSQSYTVTIYIKNTGSTSTSKNFVVNLSINTAPDYNGNQRYLDDIYVNGGILAGQTITKTHTVTIPCNYSIGTRYFLAGADALNDISESSESDNNLPFGVLVKTGADLVPLNYSLSHSAIDAGNSLTAYFAIDNNGASSTGSFNTGFYLSNSTVLVIQQSIYLGGYNVNGVSGCAQTIGLNKLLTIPQSTTTGQYYLHLWVDNNEVISEIYNSNNFQHKPIFVNGGFTPLPPLANPATNITSSSFTANWNSSSGANNYLIDVSRFSDFSTYDVYNLNVGNNLSQTFTSLSNTTYYYRIRACYNSNCSANSNVILVTTLPDNCVHWVGTAPSNPLLIEAAEYLCNHGVIVSSQQYSPTQFCNTADLAILCYNSLFYKSNYEAYSDNFPSPIVDEIGLNADEQAAIHAMLYLEYNDGIPCFERNSFNLGTKRSIFGNRAVRTILEAWKITPDWSGYDKNSFADSWFLCGVTLNDPYYGYIQKAYNLGLLNGTIYSGCEFNCPQCFCAECQFTLEDAYIILYNVMNYFGGNPPSISQSDYFIPNSFKPSNFGTNNSLDRGIFDHYEDQSFTIPGGGLPLLFSHSYHSNRAELPYLPSYGFHIGDDLLTRRLNPLGYNWSHTYNCYILRVNNSLDYSTADYRLIINWPDGVIQSYNPSAKQYETTGIHDQIIINQYDNFSNVKNLTILKPDGMKYTFEVDRFQFALLNLIEIKDKNNNSITLNYVDGETAWIGQGNQYFYTTRLGRVIENFSGRSISFNYKNNSNILESVTDNIGRSIHFNVNTNTNDLEDFYDAKSNPTHYSYGFSEKEKHLLKQITRPNGNKIDNTYYNRKLNTSKNSSYSITVNWSQDYFTGGNTFSTIMVSKNGQNYETKFEHDSRGNPTSITDPTGSNLKFEYGDPNNPDKPTKIIDNSKNTNYTFQYDNLGNPITKVKIAGANTQTERFTYNNFSQIEKYIDANGNETNYDYTLATGDLKNIYQPNGITTTYTYNSNGNPVTMVNPAGIAYQYHYNGTGNLDSINVLGTGIKATATYDFLSRIVSTKDPKGIRNTFVYDPNDNITDENYDPSGLNFNTHLDYDANDNLIKTTDPRSIPTDLEYDPITDDLKAESHGGQKKNWTYNTDGTVKSYTNKNRHTFEYEYGRLGTPSAGKLLNDGYNTYVYDASSHELTQVIHDGKTISYTYDPLFRINEISYNDLSNNKVKYEYDLNDNIKRIQYPINPNWYFDYWYDSLNRLVWIKDWNGNYLVQYFYLKDGRLDYDTYGNGTSNHYYYDKAGRLDSISTKKNNGEVIISVAAILDLNGNHVRESSFMKFVNGPLPKNNYNKTINYNYTSNSNRLENSSDSTYQYNNNGATINVNAGSQSLEWDQQDKLLKCTYPNSGKSYQYEYDGYGNRRRFNDTRYVLDLLNSSNVLIETDLAGNPKSLYVHGLGLVCRIDPQTNQVSYYHYDFRGSTFGITNNSQNFTHQYKYEEFGNVEHRYINGFANPFEFVGKYGIIYDETGYSYMRARYYDPLTGRFLSEDPVWGNNLYAYADNNPVNKIDPSGQISIYNNLIDNINTNIDEGRNAEALLGIVSAMGYKAGEYALYEVGSGIILRGASGVIRSIKGNVGVGQFSDDLVKAARKKYQTLAGKIQLHHPFPKYMGGAKKQTLVPLDAAYHQQITNEFYKYWPRKSPGQIKTYPTYQQAQEIMQKVYRKYPLPGN